MSLQLVDPQSTANEVVEFTTTLSAMSGDIIEKLFAIEAVLLQMPQVEVPLRHCFGNKVYVREMTAPKGIIIIGKLHKYKQVNIVIKGDISVLTEDGWKRMKSGEMFESPAGVKRALVTHEETVWTTICGTEETDPDKALDELTIGSYQEFLQYKGDPLWLA
jgi:quercetin dioxygenase-like cupin family protein